MGLFHCPMGAPFYDDEDCIDCGMCIATTNEEMVAASKKIRAYLKANAADAPAVRKIVVSGKGGVGKSTIVTLMANALMSEDYNVLVLDTDESNPGLFRLFGFDKEPKPLMTLLSRFSLGEPEPDTEWITRDEIAIEDIPSEYILSRNGLKFMMVGKIEDPFQGCACTMADVTRDLIEKLVVGDNEVVLVDMEAGIESYGRGVERSADTVLMIVEPSFESMALAAKIGYMAEGMGIKRTGAILNKVTSNEVRERMITELDKKSIRSLGTVYLDPQLSEASFEGTALGHSKAMEDIKEITKLLLNEAK
ncbi:MAG: P-loop NTPase [Dehalococcoidales bacterium]|nr:MAG: P-loop NTPase [Dehalococcoidales bacterium]